MATSVFSLKRLEKRRGHAIGFSLNNSFLEVTYGYMYEYKYI